MTDQPLAQLLLLLGSAVAVIVAVQRLRIPSSLGYLFVGVLLGPHTPGPVIPQDELRALAEFGIVFLLFTIGLNFSLPQIHALRHTVFGLGTGQVVFTTLAVGVTAWLAGLPPAAAFVVGAVFAQSSTTIIVKQLAEQGEDQTRHGRLATAMSVFQDVTAVPFLVVIPVLGAASGLEALPAALAWALGKAVLALGAVLLAGRWLLRPLFHAVAERRSAELFTLTVLFVSLAAAWGTSALGLSMAFGAFLAGMVLGDTEFRHQVEAAIRPFRDVLLGLFFVGIGMLFDLGAIPHIWPWASAGALALLAIKTVLVARLVRWAGVDLLGSWRTGLLLAVGGEFGFALIAIALASGAIAPQVGQIALTAVLFSMIVAPFLIRYNHALAVRVAGARVSREVEQPMRAGADATGRLSGHAIVCGYGRIGQSIGHLLEAEKVPYLALDLDPVRVREARTAGEPVYYGDAAEPATLEAVGVAAARLVVISHDDLSAALRALQFVRGLRPDLPVMVRTRDERHAETLRAAGATEVVPETLEAGLMIALHALLLLEVPTARVVQRMQESRKGRYRLLRELYGEEDALFPDADVATPDRVLPVRLSSGSRAVGRTLAELALEGVAVTALVRAGKRELAPSPEVRLEPDDAVVLFGPPEALQRAERALLG
jgi:CPA2 family monovalent cation:H+ antiporter-2